MTEEESSEIGEASQYPYSVKITQTALGARISVHAYAHELTDAIEHALIMYDQTRYQLEKSGKKLAPEEPTPRKEVKDK